MSPTAVPVAPPAGYPPIVVTVDFAGLPDGPWSTGSVRAGRLVLESPVPGTVSGVAAHPRPLRDVLLDARMSLTLGSPADFLGCYLRQSGVERYLACGVGPEGRVGMFAVDGAVRKAMVEGDLPPDLPFNSGLGQWNRLTILACGPSVTMLLNGAVVAGVTVDPRFQEGHAGIMMIKGDAVPVSRAEIGWLQARAVLPDQPETVTRTAVE